MANESNVQDLFGAEEALVSAVRQLLAQLVLQLRNEEDQDVRDKINNQIGELNPLYIRLSGKGIAIIAAQSKNDVENIKAVSADVQRFIFKIKKVEKMVAVTTSLIKFVVVCLGDTTDPLSIYDAGKGVYEAMNETIEKEGKKGAHAAIEPMSAMVPSLISG
ncbi:hypothetical protein [Pseudomonas carassii]|uniref:Uncharacterized protein n=1 Tax=Pseudomonas carassii TaxID=3115855 RepID=A0ABU7HC52_9PSED|nr:hypothetical protein [Pseudomonas sp. 137P]MEE1888196.1 hypothetical protein [Pseudomonas sp. 137P]